MSEMKFPAVSAEEPASAGQIKMLKEIGKFREGIGKDEASILISAYMAANLMSTGIHKLKVDSIEEAVDGTGKKIIDKNGNPGLKITFRNKEKQKISDIFYYPLNSATACPSEFKLRNLKRAMKLKADEEQNPDVVKNSSFWGLVAEVHHIDESGNPITDKEGKVQMNKVLLAEYYAGDVVCPTILGDPALNNGIPSSKFVSTKLKTKSSNTGTTSSPMANTASSTAVSNDEWA